MIDFIVTNCFIVKKLFLQICYMKIIIIYDYRWVHFALNFTLSRRHRLNEWAAAKETDYGN